jgi:hypothetical protein
MKDVSERNRLPGMPGCESCMPVPVKTYLVGGIYQLVCSGDQDFFFNVSKGFFSEIRSRPLYISLNVSQALLCWSCAELKVFLTVF